MIRKIRRVRTHAHEGGGTLYFKTIGGSRQNPTRFFDPDEVPEFEGEEAWFEVEPLRGPVWMTWRFLRQVDEAGKPFARAAPALPKF